MSIKQSLRFFILLSANIHIFLGFIFLAITFFTSKQIKKESTKETFIEFKKPTQEPIIKTQVPETIESLVNPANYQVEPKTILYNEPIAYSEKTIPLQNSQSQKEVPLQESQIEETPLNQPTEKTETIKSLEITKPESLQPQSLPDTTSSPNETYSVETESLSPSLPDAISSSSETDSIEEERLTPSKNGKSKFSKKTSSKTKNFKKTFSQEALKEIALKNLLKKDSTPTNQPKKLSFENTQFPMINGEPGDRNSVGYSVEATIENATKNLAVSLYQKKFIDHLVTSLHIARSKKQYEPKESDATGLFFILETDEQGKVIDFAITKSSSNPEFDALLTDAIKIAIPFPPIPKHLQINRFRLGNIKINV